MPGTVELDCGSNHPKKESIGCGKGKDKAPKSLNSMQNGKYLIDRLVD